MLACSCEFRLKPKECGGQGGPLERQLEQQLRGAELQRLRLEAAHAEQTIEDLRAVLRAALERPPDPDAPCQGLDSELGHVTADGEASSSSAGSSAGSSGHKPDDDASPAAGQAAEPALRRSAPVLALNPLWVPDGGACTGPEESPDAGFGRAGAGCGGVAGGPRGLASGGLERGVAGGWGAAGPRGDSLGACSEPGQGARPNHR